MTKFVVALILFALPLLASSGNGSGLVTFLLINNDTTPTWVVFNISNTTSHACVNPNATLGRYKFPVDTVKGSELLALLLSAEARKIPVAVQGSGLCIEQNREGIDYLYIGNPSQ